MCFRGPKGACTLPATACFTAWRRAACNPAIPRHCRQGVPTSQASGPGAVAVCTAEWAGDWAGPPAGRGGAHREDIGLERKRPAVFVAFE